MIRAPYVRGSSTSRAAARSLSEKTLARLERRVFDCIRRAGEVGRTDDELEVRCRLSHQTTSARRRALVRGGLVKDSGATRPTRSGRNASIWVLGKQDHVRPGARRSRRSARPSRTEMAEAFRYVDEIVRIGRSRGVEPTAPFRKLALWLRALLKDA